MENKQKSQIIRQCKSLTGHQLWVKIKMPNNHNIQAALLSCVIHEWAQWKQQPWIFFTVGEAVRSTCRFYREAGREGGEPKNFDNNLIKLDQSGTNLIKFDQTQWDLIKMEKSGSNMIRPDQNGIESIKLDQTQSNLIKNDQTWSSLFKLDQIGSTLTWSDQMASMGRFQ